MKKTILKVLGVMAPIVGILFLLGADQPQQKHAEVDFSISCVECHQETNPELTKAWYEGKHGLVNVGCFVCHDDGEVRFAPKPTSENCVACHSDYTTDAKGAEIKDCFACHDGHHLKFHVKH